MRLAHLALDLRATALIAVLAAGVGACGDDLSAPETWCDGLCLSVSRCGFNANSCVEKCVADRPGLANLSVAETQAESPCLAKLSCDALSGNEAAWHAQTEACWDAAGMSLAATSQSRDFCVSHARFIFTCGYIYTVERCAQDYARWSDAALARLARCETSATCEAFEACEEQALDGPS